MKASILAGIVATASAAMPSVELQNAAVPGCMMEKVGLGTGGYSAGRSPEARPEHWNVSEGHINSMKWFSIGGRRFDSADGYPSAPGVASGLLNSTDNWTSTPRNEVFITYKIGPPHPLGRNEAMQQLEEGLKLFNTSYFDLVLIHWPSDNSSTAAMSSTDIYCNPKSGHYSPSQCRTSTWTGLLDAKTTSKARAVGVSNFEVKHLADVMKKDEPLTWPAVNQFEFHGYWHEFELVKYCLSNNITVNSYAPLGTPDVEFGFWKPVLTNHPTAQQVGQKYGKSAAQVWLRWALQHNVIVNPRSWNISHQRENMDVFDFTLSAADMNTLDTIPHPAQHKVCPDPSTKP
eukprot:TRINITY_DN11128_c0_g1_i1.p1 TRINITY_DN11128_c0_g1~~TRINITY_DN11128_c0_g1_i1.p1  ORF type:complete len:346 (+),score=57.44 TRINITY_DN11128_c0_g1_i1:45-1082(+)